MNAGATAERVHEALRRRILDGAFRPGERLDPAVLAAELNSSVTPVRDALHLLSGRKLVESRTSEGFHLPAIDAPALEDLYRWNAQVMTLIVRMMRTSAMIDLPPAAPIAERAATLFSALARTSGNLEHAAAVEALNDRLHAARRVEAIVLDTGTDDLNDIRAAAENDGTRSLVALISTYHRRRQRRAAEIVRALYRRE